MDFSIVRTLRTPHSERFLLQRAEKDFAALDLHYLAGGKVDGTFILFEDSGLGEADVPGLLSKLDEMILPDVSLAERNLSFTVVMGKVLGAFQPEVRPADAPAP